MIGTAAIAPRLQATFWRSPMLDVLAAFIIVLTFAAPVASGFRPSHAGLILFSGMALLTLWDRNVGRGPMIALLLFLSVIVTSTLSAFVHGPGANFATLQARNALMFGGIFLAGYSMSAERLRAVLNLVPYFCAGAVIYILALRPDSFSYGGRLSYGEYLFAPGLSYVIALSVAVAFAIEKKRWFHYGLIAALLLAEALTFTRAEIISIGILFWARIGFRRGLAIIAIITLPLAIFFSTNADIKRLLIIQDIAETGGSGRVQVWSQLIGELLNAPTTLLFGFGPGNVNYVVTASQSVDKAHNVPLDTLYSYGIFGFTLLTALCAILARKVVWWGGNSQEILVRDIIIVSTVNALVNGSFFDGSLNAISTLFFAFILAVLRQRPATG